jgi:DNA invertase Pin-like site-specific DNA recombinase
MHAEPLVAYTRVSTSGQGRSGLGIEAQRYAIAQFAKAEGFEIVREFVEVETGKGSDALDRRLQLKAALAAARKIKCQVAVAKLDTLRQIALNARASPRRGAGNGTPRVSRTSLNAHSSKRELRTGHG